METQILEKYNLSFEINFCWASGWFITVFLLGNRLFNFGTNTVVEEENFLVEEFLQFLCNWFQRVLV